MGRVHAIGSVGRVAVVCLVRALGGVSRVGVGVGVVLSGFLHRAGAVVVMVVVRIGHGTLLERGVLLLYPYGVLTTTLESAGYSRIGEGCRGPRDCQ
jgi:hypothetical protein